MIRRSFRTPFALAAPLAHYVVGTAILTRQLVRACAQSRD